MPDVSLIVADPGHFHAALVQNEMYPDLSPQVHVYAPLGPDLADYLTRRMCRERLGTVAIFSGRNRGKVRQIRPPSRPASMRWPTSV